MKKILLLSDTHSHMDKAILRHGQWADEIWHAGDFGSFQVVEQLEQIAPLRGVYGNIDGAEIRGKFHENERFFCQEVEVWMRHIGGYPPAYTPEIRAEIRKNPPKLFISGHSHILKVMPDRNLSLLHMNPGACGFYGWHKVRTMLRFCIDGADIRDLEVIELEK